MRSLGIASVCIFVLSACEGQGGGGDVDATTYANDFVTDPALVPLAKAEGWTIPFRSRNRENAVIEIAYDRTTAEHAWNERLPGDLAAGAGIGPGVYGSLDDVDFEAQAVIVWSHGDSGCVEWLANIDTIDGMIHVELGEVADDCTEDYQMLIAVERDRLPSPERLPMSEIVGIDGSESVMEFRSSDPRNREAEVDPSVTPLAKAHGWREALLQGFADGVVEIAYDQDVAELAWADNVPDDLEPWDLLGEPGVYASLGDVNFEQRALVVVSLGESGSCPQWVTNISTRAEGLLEIAMVTFVESYFCTGDYKHYRLLLAVDRDRLPDPNALPYELVTDHYEVPVVAYPAETAQP
jgi:hypothetical protein